MTKDKFHRVAALLFSLLPTFALSQECDPTAFRYIDSADLDIVQSLAYLRTVSEENFQQRKKDGAIGVSIPNTPFTFDGTWNDFQEKRRELFERYSFSASYADSSSYLKAGLDKNGLAAYTSCLKSRYPVRAWLEAGSPNAKRIIVKIDVAAQGIPAPIPVIIELSGIASGEQPRYQRQLTNPGDTSITVNRDTSQTFSATFRIQNRNGEDIASDSLYIPNLVVRIPETTFDTSLSYCIGHGGPQGPKRGPEGLQLWGPNNEDCGGMGGKWGNYTQSATAVAEICACKGHGGVEGVVSWGPKGTPCWGIPDWGAHTEDCHPLTKGNYCACSGHGGVEGVELWGPKGAYCGGIWSPGYSYDCN